MSRRLARDIAFLALFEIDVGKQRAEPALKHSLEGFNISSDEEEFVSDLVKGVVEKKAFLDDLIRKHLVKWELDRLSAVDRNLLRLALFEIIYRADIPNVVSINEALELAKKYGSTGEAVGFINGVLDRVVGEVFERES